MASSSPYLRDKRLNDIVAAIQMMAVNDRYRMSASDWARMIEGNPNREDYWCDVFVEHPEFFRTSEIHPGNYALILRRALPSRYHRKRGIVLTREEYDILTKEERDRYMSRAPLSQDQTKMLLDTAIALHKNAVEAQRDWRWWVPAGLGFVGSLAGAILGGLFHWK
jgi:hypothetical protein